MKARKAEIFSLVVGVDQMSEDFYSEDHLYEECDNDLINGAEEGFMIGYMNS